MPIAGHGGASGPSPASPSPSFFDRFPMRPVRHDTLDDVLAEPGRLRVLFLWGENCPNCEIAKHEILREPARFQWPDVQWLHANVYADPAMGVRFGLHGVPAFVVFDKARKLGRISQWPGSSAFAHAIQTLRSPAALSSSPLPPS